MGLQYGNAMGMGYKYFIISNYQFQTVLQRKQLDIFNHP